MPVTDGPFRYVRNPIYLVSITLLGVGMLYSSWSAMDLGLPLFLLAYFHVAVVRIEEPELRRRFGAKYAEYLERVPHAPPSRAMRPMAIHAAVDRQLVRRLPKTALALHVSRWYTGGSTSARGAQRSFE